MDNERKLAHVVAYYLSKFDKEALQNLGYKTDNEAFTKIAAKLMIPPNYIKFRRDEFDVVHPHRLGWHKRKMSLSIINTIQALQDLEEISLREIVETILFKNDQFDNLDDVMTIFPSETSEKLKTSKVFVPRSITGKKAEEYFIDFIASNCEKFKGNLIDKRDHGCGYDFEIINNDQIQYFEVKGLAAESGGILFTSKEWATAIDKGDNYYLCIVSSIESKVNISLLQNPHKNLRPKKNILTTIQVNYSVNSSALVKIIESL